MSGQFKREVKLQYEDFPYPQRDPNDENNRLLITFTDQMSHINHYGFRGDIPLYKKGEGETFRVLVAGGGTGDASTFLAFQLKDFNAEIIYLDISESSLKVAESRARVRGLDNIKFINGSILDIPEMGFEPFHYINSVGVLHHLESPLAGLQSLKQALRDDGVLGVMVYGKYGRESVYKVQNMMRVLNTHETEAEPKLKNTKDVLQILNDRDWFKNDPKSWMVDVEEFGDVGLYDLFLHSQDRAYDIKELYQWVEEEAGLKIIDFFGPGLTGKAAYMPQLHIKDKKILEKILRLEKAEQQFFTEIYLGNIAKHNFYASKSGKSMASQMDMEMIPYFTFSLDCKKLADVYLEQPNAVVKIGDELQGFINMSPTKSSYQLFSHIDGEKTLGEIFASIEEDDEQLMRDFNTIYSQLFICELMLLKSRRASEAINHIEKSIIGEGMKNSANPDLL